MTVYTSIIGPYDFLKPILIQQVPGIKFVLFTDQPMTSEVFQLCTPDDLAKWEIRKVEVMKCGPARTARYYKIKGFELIDDEITFALDGSFFINTCIKSWMGRMGNDDFVTVAHPFDDCIYVDAKACIRMEKGDKTQLENQIKEYEELGIPKKNGLIAAGMLMRRKTPKIQAVCEEWWQQLESHSVRDQVAFGYINWKYPGIHRSFKWNYTVQSEFIHCAHNSKPWGRQKAREINESRQKM